MESFDSARQSLAMKGVRLSEVSNPLLVRGDERDLDDWFVEPNPPPVQWSLLFAAGLGSAHCVYGVCRVVPELVSRVRALTDRRSVAVPKRLSAPLPLAEATGTGLYAFGVLDPGVLGCVSRPLLRLDEQGRLHDWEGRPAVDWERGRGLWYWRGVRMTEQQGRSPDFVTPRRIAGWANAERRRVAIERIGLEAFVRGLNAELVQQDDSRPALANARGDRR